MEKDTIVANATPLMPSAVSIIRISGEKAFDIGKKLSNKKSDIKERTAYFSKIFDRNNEVIDEGLVLFFKSPKSFTGEDVVEIQTHGSVPVVKKIISEAIYYGARFAEPGEFTKRAFLNGKIDLTQAEAIAQLIEAKSEKASKAAVNILEGKLNKKINNLKNQLMELISLIEAELNFPEDVEEIDFDLIKTNLIDVSNQINDLLKTYKKGQIIREGIRLAIVGRPNVGKSSLFNSFIGYERAIVSEIKGTTRDFIEESLIIQGVPVKLLDTAGIRKTEDKIENLGIKLAKDKIKEADIVIFVFDVYEGLTKEDLEIYEEIKYKNPIVVGNKIDLHLDKINEKYYFKDIIFLSSKTLQGFDKLENEISKRVGLLEYHDDEIFINLRHFEILKQADEKIKKIIENLQNYEEFKEILILEIQEIEKLLKEIIGEITTEDILGNIFSNFCIGK
jgi:tRNA modification GTPase